MSALTGSRAYERFTGSQISKIFHTKRDTYNITEVFSLIPEFGSSYNKFFIAHAQRISLVSSFACSIFLGDYASIDYSDGSGMNLLDIRGKSWSETCIKALTDDSLDLIPKLGPPVPTTTIQGVISPYFVERFGFSPDCQILTFTGDNPSSFAGTSNTFPISAGF